jgi:Tfp pilus assembly protein PilF
MHLFEGLLFYEIVLLGLGVLLFLVVLGLLIYSIINKRDIKIFALFFVISIVMIAYPSIQKIKFNEGVVEIEKGTKALEQNPADTTAQKELERTLADIEQRQISNPITLVKIAEAQAAIGDSAKALKNVDQALKEKPDLPQAQRLRSNIYVPRSQVVKE